MVIDLRVGSLFRLRVTRKMKTTLLAKIWQFTIMGQRRHMYLATGYALVVRQNFGLHYITSLTYMLNFICFIYYRIFASLKNAWFIVHCFVN